jgi:hypothetical protein
MPVRQKRLGGERVDWKTFWRVLAGIWLVPISVLTVFPLSLYGGLMFWAIDGCRDEACVATIHAVPIVLLISTVAGWSLFRKWPGISILVSGALIGVPVLIWQIRQIAF